MDRERHLETFPWEATESTLPVKGTLLAIRHTVYLSCEFVRTPCEAWTMPEYSFKLSAFECARSSRQSHRPAEETRKGDDLHSRQCETISPTKNGQLSAYTTLTGGLSIYFLVLSLYPSTSHMADACVASLRPLRSRSFTLTALACSLTCAITTFRSHLVFLFSLDPNRWTQVLVAQVLQLLCASRYYYPVRWVSKRCSTQSHRR